MKYFYQQLLKTRRALLFFAVSLFTLAANAAWVDHYPATTVQSYAYGGVYYSNATSSQFWAIDQPSAASRSNKYSNYGWACEYANKGATSYTFCPAFFLGFATSTANADAGNFDIPYTVISVSGTNYSGTNGGRKGTGTAITYTDITTAYRTTDKTEDEIYACFTMILQEAVMNDGTAVPAGCSVSRSITCAPAATDVTLTATVADGYEFKGWRVKGTNDIVSTETSYTVNVTERAEYEGVFGAASVVGTYCHAQVNVYPTADANLGTVALNTSSTVPATFSTTGITAADNTENEGLYFFAKEANGYFLGFANGSAAVDNNMFVTSTEADGVYSATGLELNGTNNSSDATADVNNVYAVFTMVKVNKVSANGSDGRMSEDLNVTVTNTSDASVVNGTIGYGQNATLTATIADSNYDFCGWRVAGTDTYVSTDATLTLTNVTEAVTYEAVFVYKREIYIGADAERDGKYWATVTNYNTTFSMVLPSTLTVYSLRYGDALSTADFSTSTSPYSIDNVYGTEAARTIRLSGSGKAKMEKDLINQVTYTSSSNTGTSSSPTYTFKYSDGGWPTDIPYSSANRWGGTNQASATNLQAALVSADAPGVYTVELFSTRSSSGEIMTWPRYNRLSGRDVAFTPSDLDDYDYYVLSKKNGIVAFYPIAAGETIPARCAYIRVDKNGGETKEYIDFLDSEIITGIENVNVDSVDANAPVYNLSGQRVSNNYKGIVIKNGNKYIRK